MRRLLLQVMGCVLLAGLAGCSRSEPVEEISLAQSGLRVRDQDLAWSEADWPMWRGPGGAGRAVDQDIVTQWGEDENIRWRSDVPGRGHASPCVVADRVLLTTALEEAEQQLVVAYDAGSGEQLWTRLVFEGNFTPADQMHGKASHANSTVASDGVLAYAAFLNGGHVYLTALDLDGNVVWQTDVGAFASTYGYAPSPVLYRSSVIVAADHVGGGYVASVDRDSGRIIWRTARPQLPSYSTPLVAQVCGRQQLLICGCKQLASYDPDTGQLNWSCPSDTISTCGTVVTDGTCVFASGGYPNHETICVHGDGSGEVIWRVHYSVYEPSLLQVEDNVFLVTDPGVSYCLDAGDGAIRWRERFRGGFSASPVVCRDKVLVTNLKGQTYVYEMDGSAYRQVAKNQLGDDCYASLAICGGAIYTRVGVQVADSRQERLYCIAAGPLEELTTPPAE